MEYIKLNNGVTMPMLGFGVYQMNDLAECEKSVTDAIQAGYRLIDTASKYGNEEAVGKGIKNSGVAREELFITTKLWLQDAGYEHTKKAFELSLKNLGLDYLDLYLIHQPFNDVYGSWRAMEALYKEGKIRAIGVSNFRPDRLMDFILYNEIKPAVNQIETHPFNQQIENNQFLTDNDILHQSWSPFGQGKLNVFENELLNNIAKKHNKSVAQVVLRWMIQRGIVVIPKSVHLKRIKENINVFDFKLDDTDMKDIKSIDTGKSTFKNHTDPEVVKWFSEL
ncbi:Aldo/keto reductase [Pustulibacterium marinum]|uniref:Aldo/keto reductase n=1 Tax=Pustulibacterium marinum TaxID=1224947 RepID=A0A1I7I9C7_9FLAO|nr:aldo/keto reductase [Pustulibacterium marinum]SFU69518.1 Aldo/keto reductase [Pustulibacterium marinum]